MALYFDDDHLNSSDRSNRIAPKSNGGIDGVSKKWEQTHASRKKYNGIGGNNMSRNQGTGELGREATLPGEAVDTSQMEPEEKYRYLQALGLMPGAEQKKDVPVQQKPNPNRPFRRGR